MKRPDYLPKDLDRETIKWLRSYGYCLYLKFIPWCSCHEPRRNIFSGNVARHQSLCDLTLAMAHSLNVSFSWQEPFTA